MKGLDWAFSAFIDQFHLDQSVALNLPPPSHVHVYARTNTGFHSSPYNCTACPGNIPLTGSNSKKSDGAGGAGGSGGGGVEDSPAEEMMSSSMFDEMDGSGISVQDPNPGARDVIAESIYGLIGEVFDMRGVFKWVRKSLMTFVQITYGSTINRCVIGQPQM